jgi:hypothetical protein
LHAESTAVDLRRAQLDQFQKLFVDAGVRAGLANLNRTISGVSA